jgi:hypothetical protein
VGLLIGPARLSREGKSSFGFGQKESGRYLTAVDGVEERVILLIQSSRVVNHVLSREEAEKESGGGAKGLWPVHAREDQA